jgi:hypothetical protein
MEDAKYFAIEVAYAIPAEQVILSLEVNDAATIEEAIHQSGILERFPEIDLSQNKVGVFGKLSKLNSTLRPGDRIEIYRPLIADPKAVRRERAAQGKVMKKGAGAASEDAD